MSLDPHWPGNLTQVVLDDNDEEVQWMSQPMQDTELINLLTAQALEKFPEEYHRISKKYGSVEYIWSIDPEPVVTGLAEPKGFQRRCDELNLERFGQGMHQLSTVQYVLTSTGLVRIFTSQLLRALAEWDALKTSPEHLHATVVSRAQTASQLLPPSSTMNGSSDGNTLPLTFSELLARPRYVGMSVRYIVQTALAQVAHWSTALEYLREIQALDEEHGRFGCRERRGQLMAQVKKITDTIQYRVLREFNRALMFYHPIIRPTIMCANNAEDYGGAEVHIDGARSQKFLEALRERSLVGAFARYIDRRDREGSDLEQYVDRCLRDISDSLATASEEEKQSLRPEILDAWAEVEMITDLIIMLGTDGEDWRQAPSDERLRAHADAVALSADIFNHTVVDRYTKSANSLKSEGAFKRIWAEFEKIAMKRAKKPLEKIVSFMRIAPSWTHPVALLPEASPSVIKSEQGEELTAPPSLSKTQRKKIKKQEKLLTRHMNIDLARELPALDLNEFSSGTASTGVSTPETASPRGDYLTATSTAVPSYVVPCVPEATPDPVVPRVPKVKRRGVANPPSDATLQTAQGTETQAPVVGRLFARSVYAIGKCYETMERLLVRNQGSMDWRDFEKLMATLKFKKTSTSGSIVVFTPPPFANAIPIVLHRPHGNEMEPYKIYDVGRQLKSHYGWSIDWFSDDKVSSQEPDVPESS